jgi:hypothetical protein
MKWGGYNLSFLKLELLELELAKKSKWLFAA